MFDAYSLDARGLNDFPVRPQVDCKHQRVKWSCDGEVSNGTLADNSYHRAVDLLLKTCRLLGPCGEGSPDKILLAVQCIHAQLEAPDFGLTSCNRLQSIIDGTGTGKRFAVNTFLYLCVYRGWIEHYRNCQDASANMIDV